jgi:hypothetical protein
MAKGLGLFRQHFADCADQHVLIGGTAATLAMEDAGLDFRATKDLDIVLHIEALNAEFGAAFWTFMERRRYTVLRASGTGKPVHYRFSKADDDRFPAMLEPFCRTPDLRVSLAARIADDLHRFRDGLAADRSFDPRSLKIMRSIEVIIERITLGSIRRSHVIDATLSASMWAVLITWGWTNAAVRALGSAVERC